MDLQRATPLLSRNGAELSSAEALRILAELNLALAERGLGSRILIVCDA